MEFQKGYKDTKIKFGVLRVDIVLLFKLVVCCLFSNYRHLENSPIYVWVMPYHMYPKSPSLHNDSHRLS